MTSVGFTYTFLVLGLAASVNIISGFFFVHRDTGNTEEISEKEDSGKISFRLTGKYTELTI